SHVPLPFVAAAAPESKPLSLMALGVTGNGASNTTARAVEATTRSTGNTSVDMRITATAERDIGGPPRAAGHAQALQAARNTAPHHQSRGNFVAPRPHPSSTQPPRGRTSGTPCPVGP